MALSDRDLDLLDHLAAGGSVAGYAREHHFSTHWAKWTSRNIRHKLGVDTLEEAVAVSETEREAVSRADFDKLTGLVTKLGDAIEDLAKAGPARREEARETVRERELDVKDHAKALGLTLEDVERLKGEKEYERFKAMQDRLEREREEEEGGEEGEENGAGKGGLGQVLDGLGGLSGVKRAKT